MFFHIIRNAVELAEIYFFAFHFHEMLMTFAKQEEDIPFLHMVEGIFYCLGAVGYLDILTRSAAFFDPVGYLVYYRIRILKIRVITRDYNKIAHLCADKTELLPADSRFVACRAKERNNAVGL